MTDRRAQETPQPESDEIVDPQDLVLKSDYTTKQDPQETVDLPGLTPQLLDDNRDRRSDLRRD